MRDTPQHYTAPSQTRTSMGPRIAVAAPLRFPSRCPELADDDAVKVTFLLEGGYKKLSPEDVHAILVASE